MTSEFKLKDVLGSPEHLNRCRKFKVEVENLRSINPISFYVANTTLLRIYGPTYGNNIESFKRKNEERKHHAEVESASRYVLMVTLSGQKSIGSEPYAKAWQQVHQIAKK